MLGDELKNAVWVEKYRPKAVETFIFENEKDKNLVEKWMDDECIPGNLLLYGGGGLGKTTLAEILIKRCVKTRDDLYKMKTRTVSEVDEFKNFLSKQPIASKKRIIYIEEFDKISNEAKGQLKDDLMEKFVGSCIFIATTNFPNRIPAPIWSRFHFKMAFNGRNIQGLYDQAIAIVKAENGEMDEGKLMEYIQRNNGKGFREIINDLQNAYLANNGKIVLDGTIATAMSLEENITGLFMKIIGTLLSNLDPKARKSCLVDPMNSPIGPEYQTLSTTLYNNYDINYEIVCGRLKEEIRFIPIKTIVGRYVEEIDSKKYPEIHMLAMLEEVMRCANELYN